MKSIKDQISELFIQPIVIAKPERVSLDKWFELIFSTHERHIEKFKARKNFKIQRPRIVEVANQIPLSVSTPLQVHKNDLIIFREDERNKTFIDCEIISEKYRTSYWLKMKPEEWQECRKNLKERRWKRRRQS